MKRNGWLFFISQTRSKTMTFSDSPQQRALERMMTAVPRFQPKGGGIMVLHRFEYTAKMCDYRYCPYYRGKRKCTADSCPSIEERILAGAASRSEVMTETMKDIHNAAFRRRLNQFISHVSEAPAKQLFKQREILRLPALRHPKAVRTDP